MSITKVKSSARNLEAVTCQSLIRTLHSNERDEESLHKRIAEFRSKKRRSRKVVLIRPGNPRLLHPSAFSWDPKNVWGTMSEGPYLVDLLTLDGTQGHTFDIISLNVIDACSSNLGRIDVLAYSTSSGMRNIARIIHKYKPSILFHLSDEFRERRYYTDIKSVWNASVKRVYHQYSLSKLDPLSKFWDIMRPLPLGYHTYGQNYTRPNDWKSMRERRYRVSSVGSVKGRRAHDAVQLMTNLQPFAFLQSGPFESARIYSNSQFVYCPNGNCDWECFRMYEAMYNGAIPLMIFETPDEFEARHQNSSHLRIPGAKYNDWKDRFELYQGGSFPGLAFYSINDAIEKVKSLSLSDMQRLQEACKKWVASTRSQIFQDIARVIDSTG